MDNTAFTDTVKRAQNGESAALEKLLKETEKEVSTFLYYLSKSEYDTSDLVQEILLKVTKKLNTLKNPESYKHWLNKLAIRHYLDFIRKNKKEANKIDKNEVFEDELFEDWRACPVTDCIGCEITDALKKSLSKLKEPYKLAIIMREFEGLSYEDIAKLTNTSIGTVKSRIARARCQLKELMKPYMEQ